MTELVVGKSYRVPVVGYYFCGRDDDWPVLGPLHEDAEVIGFPPRPPADN
ncbi:MAG: hypothetical protein L0332_34540 [Chloroflexi bacterium]|nr:hypothetical protein [Chloroflexota bacterium]